MKQLFTSLALVLVLQASAQITPALLNQFLIGDEFLPQSIAYYDDQIYMPDAFGGRILKTEATTDNAVIDMVLTNLNFPTGILIIGDELYVLEAFSTLFPSQNTGKLSKVNLTDPNLNVVDVLTGLNVPVGLTGDANNLFITELITTVDPEFPDDLEFQSTTISKIQLTANPIKTVLFQNRDYVLDLKLYANELYWTEEQVIDVKLFNYQTTQTPQEVELFTFSADDYPERILIENDFLLFATYTFDGNQEIPFLSAIDLSDTSLGSTQVSTPFIFNTSDVILGGMFVQNNTLFASAEVFDVISSQDLGLLYQLDISTLSKEQFEDNLALQIYPNPAQSEIYFNEMIQGLQVFDINGRILSYFQSSADRFDVSSLSPGLYLLKGKTLNGKPFQHKLVKQ